MDTMSLSYADVALAKDVLYGMYADTAARGQPQVPCQNEDATTNMASYYCLQASCSPLTTLVQPTHCRAATLVLLLCVMTHIRSAWITTPLARHHLGAGRYGRYIQS
jgi:hypothetical protein